MKEKTIVAQVTPSGKSGVGIIRTSGTQSKKIAKLLLKKIPKKRTAEYLNFFDKKKTLIDKGIAIWFPAPHSFTGEDVLELQGHGNPILLDILIKNILTIKNVRIAYPGEFSKRAFLNGKIDLIQAESITDLINAKTKESILSSLQIMQGTFSTYITNLSNLITEIRTKIETNLNFSNDESFPITNQFIDKKIKALLKRSKQIKNLEKKGSVLNEGISVVLSGPPNVGKSTIFNCLSLKESAIVTNIKGTTRDILKEEIYLNGTTIKIFDTAGLHKTKNEIEKIGISRTWKKIYKSNHTFLVLDCSIELKKNVKIYEKFIKKYSEKNKVTVIMNKADIKKQKYGFYPIKGIGKCLFLSGKKKLGFQFLTHYLQKIVKKENSSESLFLSRRRHLNTLKQFYSRLKKGEKTWKENKNILMLAEDLQIMQRKLGEITGEITSEKLLDEIFSSFCIGK